MKKFYFCKLSLIVLGALLALQSAVAEIIKVQCVSEMGDAKMVGRKQQAKPSITKLTNCFLILACLATSDRASAGNWNNSDTQHVNGFITEPFFNVSVNEQTKLIERYSLVDTYSKSGRAIEVDADSGDIIWQWVIPSSFNAQKRICKGATLQVMPNDSFNVLVPWYGVVNVSRDGKYKVILKDKQIDHAAHQYDESNIVYVRGFVKKNEPSVVAKKINSGLFSGSEYKWTPVKTFPTKTGFTIKQERSCGAPARWANEKDWDWAHVNHVEHLNNGNLLISLRNFSTFIELDPTTNKVVYKNNTIPGVHQPTPYDGGYVAADRACGKESLHHIRAGGSQSRLLTGEFLTVRGIEYLGKDHFLITSATSITEISLDGKIHYKATVPKANPVHEKSVTSQSDLPPWGYCAPTVLYSAKPTLVKR